MNTEHEVQPDTESTVDHSEQPIDPSHHEARKYRKRAQAAEKIAADLQRELDAKSSRVSELEETVTALERRSRIDELLLEADAMDLESARLLTGIAVAGMDKPDVDAAVGELKRRKPYLFRNAPHSRSSALSPRVENANRSDRVEHAAAEASATGSRTDLLRYLRLRRKK